LQKTTQRQPTRSNDKNKKTTTTMVALKRWSKKVQGKMCVSKFNEFVQSGGTRGWDPRRMDESEYTLPLLVANDITKPYCIVSAGGHKDNKNSDKALSGFRRSASEFWVRFPKETGVRMKDFCACLLPSRHC
jgi:hypothetical protein